MSDKSSQPEYSVKLAHDKHRLCSRCRRTFTTSNYWIVNYMTNNQYHIICFNEFISNSPKHKRLPSYSKQLNGIDEISNNKQREIVIRLLWPHQLDHNIAARENVHYHIADLNKQELRIELEKRDLNQFVDVRNRPENRWIIMKTWKKRLLEYFKKDKNVNHNLHLLITGYCNEISADNKLNHMPKYLQDIIFKHYPKIID